MRGRMSYKGVLCEGQMARQLGMLTSLAEDWSAVPDTCVGWLTDTNSSSRGSDILFLFKYMRTYMHAGTHTNTHSCSCVRTHQF